MDLRSRLRFHSEFPASGMPFWDLSPLWADAEAFAEATRAMIAPVLTLEPTHVLALESRGFIFGGALARELKLGFVAARKPGKLPGPTLQETYTTSDGRTEALEIQEGAFKPGDRVLIVDDVLATGGTAAAAKALILRTGAQALALTLCIEVADLPGREKLAGLPVFSVLRV